VKKKGQRLVKKGLIKEKAAFANTLWSLSEILKLKEFAEIYKGFKRKQIAQKLSEVLDNRSIKSIELELIKLGH
jgi:hypothetical protein